MKMSSCTAMSRVYAVGTCSSSSSVRHSTRSPASNGGAPSPASSAASSPAQSGTPEARSRKPAVDTAAPAEHHRWLPQPVGDAGEDRPADRDPGGVHPDERPGRADRQRLPGEQQQRDGRGAERQPAERAGGEDPGDLRGPHTTVSMPAIMRCGHEACRHG